MEKSVFDLEKFVKICIVTLNNQKITLEFEESALIDDVKLEVQKTEGIPPDQQRLIFAGRQVEDGRTLKACGIKGGATLHLVSRL